MRRSRVLALPARGELRGIATGFRGHVATYQGIDRYLGAMDATFPF